MFYFWVKNKSKVKVKFMARTITTTAETTTKKQIFTKLYSKVQQFHKNKNNRNHNHNNNFLGLWLNWTQTSF